MPSQPAATLPSHNALQLAAFSEPSTVAALAGPLPAEVQQRLARIAGSVPGLSSSSRVVDVGSGTGVLIPHLQALGVQDILAVDLSGPMLEVLRAQHAAGAGHLGNDLGTRTWQGDILALPNYLGWAADAFFFNGMFGNLHSPRAALLKAVLMAKPGGHLVISHPLGRAWQTSLAAQQPQLTPHALPSRAELQQLVQDLPLQVVEFVDEPELYLAVLQVPHRYALAAGPVRLAGPVVAGFGRGSRQLGTATANIDPGPLAGTLAGLPRGVYYGWARMVPGPGASGWTDADCAVQKMVMNVGQRPTVNVTGAEAATVEVHLMGHTFSQDFYGQGLRVVALGYIRPELRFSGGLPELIDRINIDKAVARNQLDDPVNKAAAQDSWLFAA